MVGAQKQKTLNSASLRDWLVMSLAVLVPVCAALGGAYLVGSELLQSQQSQNQQTQVEEVRTQSRLLLENVWDQIDSLKIKAIDSFRNHAARDSQMDPEIKAVGELTFNSNGTVHALKDFSQNSAGWKETVAPKDFASLAEAGARQISAREIRDAGTSIVLIPKAPGQGTQLIGAAFLNGTQPVFVVADPSEVFSHFARWTSRREAGNLRGYLISSSGKVLVHSERVYSGSDFSASEVYEQALRSAFRNQRVSGVATFRAVDLRTVTTSYARLTGLPLAVVVERVVRPGNLSPASWLIPSLLLLTASLVICLFSVLGVLKYVDFIRRPVRAAEAPNEVAQALDQVGASASARLTEALQMRELRSRLHESLGMADEAAPETSAESTEAPELPIGGEPASGPETPAQ